MLDPRSCTGTSLPKDAGNLAVAVPTHPGVRVCTERPLPVGAPARRHASWMRSRVAQGERHPWHNWGRALPLPAHPLPAVVTPVAPARCSLTPMRVPASPSRVRRSPLPATRRSPRTAPRPPRCATPRAATARSPPASRSTVVGVVGGCSRNTLGVVGMLTWHQLPGRWHVHCSLFTAPCSRTVTPVGLLMVSITHFPMSCSVAVSRRFGHTLSRY